MLANIIAIIVIVLIVGCAVTYIIRAKKKGQRCIGCPMSKSCQGCCSCCPSESSCKKNNESSDTKTN